MAGARGQLGSFYARYSQIIDKLTRGVIAFLIFVAINSMTGYMKRLDSTVVALGLAVICAFLPTPFTTLLGFALLLAHLSKLSLPVMGVAAALFLIMYAVYFHFTPRHTIFLLLVPLAFWLKIPVVIPIAYGLVGTPVLAYPIALGCIMYYTIDYIHASAKTFDVTGVTSIIDRLSTMVRKILTNKEMWLYVLAFVVCLWAVSIIRRRDLRHGWKIAVFMGALVDLLILTIGAAVLSVKLNLGMILLGHLLGVAIGMVMDYLFFNVDYKHKETLQFEDDDYVYYVSAIPKVRSGEEPQREVKRLKKEPDEKREPGEIAKNEAAGRKKKSESQNKPGKKSSAKKGGSKQSSDKKKRASEGKKQPGWKDGMTDELLMTQSLRRDLEKEL
ncbi:MAG: hypothetical protein II787_04475 [Lachnospiraceae bacterium]|nr:hypothetical protein [Lachnospiraceae bacterium]